MILDCPACGAALVFDPETGKMKCESCSNLFETFELQEDYIKKGEREIKNVKAREKDLLGTSDMSVNRDKSPVEAARTSFNPESSFDNPVYDHASDENETIPGFNGETMECSIYTCSACGAEIMVNDIEVSTFCSFCGQPTLVFSRMAEAKKPRYILPFSVTKEKAMSLIKDNFANGYFVPDDIKNLKPERVRGIYIPYWLFDIHYEDLQLLSGEVGSGKNSRTYYYTRKAECNFDKLAFDGSERLNDTVSRKLNPYHTAYLKDFSAEYLSGFYADFFDVEPEKLKAQALLRAQSTFDNEIKRSVSASKVSIIKKKPSFTIDKIHYALFPAWFVTFLNEGKPYTLLVNGQTEKLVGSVPFDKEKVIKTVMILGFFLTVLIWCLLYPFLLAKRMPFNFHYLSGIIMAIPFYKIGSENFKQVKESRELTALKQTDQYVKNRQE